VIGPAQLRPGGRDPKVETAIGAAHGAASLLASGCGFHAWPQHRGPRPPGACRPRLLLAADTPWPLADWLPHFLDALALEAKNRLLLPLRSGASGRPWAGVGGILVRPKTWERGDRLTAVHPILR
jgi:hypothetical protein